MILEWSRPAEADLIDIFDYIGDDDPAVAPATVDRIEDTALHLAESPLMGREGSVPETRELPIPGLRFLLIYRVQHRIVRTPRELHEARRWPPE